MKKHTEADQSPNNPSVVAKVTFEYDFSELVFDANDQREREGEEPMTEAEIREFIVDDLSDFDFRSTVERLPIEITLDGGSAVPAVSATTEDSHRHALSYIPCKLNREGGNFKIILFNTNEGQLPNELEELDYWNAGHPEYPRADWRLEVLEGNTLLGYWHWAAIRQDED